MNGMQVKKIPIHNETPRLELKPNEIPQLPTNFMHPEEIVRNICLTPAEKREILASWTSDICTVPNAPTLRQLDNGAVVRVGNFLQALNFLDENATSEQTVFNPFRLYAGLRSDLSRRRKSSLQRNWPDDEEPPLSPAMGAKPLAKHNLLSQPISSNFGYYGSSEMIELGAKGEASKQASSAAGPGYTAMQPPFRSADSVKPPQRTPMVGMPALPAASAS